MSTVIMPELQAAIDRAADEHDLPVPLLRALGTVESGWNPFATRHEPLFRYVVLVGPGGSKPFRRVTPDELRAAAAPGDFLSPGHSSRDTEWAGQRTSWGPLQLMGAVARELGFTGEFPRLCTLTTGVDLPARHLAILRGRFLTGYGWEGVVRAYNTGHPDPSPAGDAYLGKVRLAGGLDL